MSKLKIVGSLIDKVAGRVDDFTLDKQEKAELLQEINKAQLEVNKIEAGQTGLLVRWRPFLGWVLSFAFGYHYLLQPFLIFIPNHLCGGGFAQWPRVCPQRTSAVASKFNSKFMINHS